MTVALVGLTSIQFYWVQSAMEIKEQQFGENVGRALNTVVYNIEKVEAANYIKNQEGFPPLMWVGRQWRVNRDAYEAWKLFCYSKAGKQ